jgi:hypothetical protein
MKHVIKHVFSHTLQPNEEVTDKPENVLASTMDSNDSFMYSITDGLKVMCIDAFGGCFQSTCVSAPEM